MIYFSLLIPLIAVIFLSWKFPKRVTMVERIIVFAVPVICIVVAKFISTHSQTNDTEYWNSYATTGIYYEFWNEWIEEQCCAAEDTAGNCISWYDCSYNQDHPAEWEVHDNIGKTHTYTKNEFEKLAVIWGNRTFKDMGRDYNTIDGDAYITQYDAEFEHTIPIVTKHTYENRIQCSKSVFNFDDIDTSEIRIYNLKNYPSLNRFYYNPIIGANNYTASRRLAMHNAHMGSKKQVHMMIIVFENQPIQAAMKQEQMWKKGNKNEVILCIGRKGKETKWAYVISWTDVEILKVRLARKAKEMEYDLINIVDMMAKEVNKDFVRKQFTDFSYIRVEPTLKAVLITFLITLLVTIIVACIVIFNRSTRGGYSSYKTNRFR